MSKISTAKSGSLDPISKSLEEDDEASKLDKAQEIFGIELPSDKNAPLPLYPGEEAFDEPAGESFSP